jgi:hypothetical protein
MAPYTKENSHITICNTNGECNPAVVKVTLLAFAHYSSVSMALILIYENDISSLKGIIFIKDIKQTADKQQ